MKWKNSFTIDEAALYATDLESFRHTKLVQNHLETPTKEITFKGSFGKLIDGTLYPSDGGESCHLIERYTTTKNILEALQNDFRLVASECSADRAKTNLEIANRMVVADGSGRVSSSKTTLTRSSLAKWFWRGDSVIALKFDSEIQAKMATEAECSKSIKGSELTTKTINTYLKTILALSDALIDGLTGTKSTDADAVLIALEKKGISHPVSSKTLAKYLSEAKELS